MKMVHKYRIVDSYPFSTRIHTELPKGAKVLTVVELEGVYHLWALVDTEAPLVSTTLYVVGTGWELPEDVGDFICTLFSEPFVCHVFERAEEVPSVLDY